VYIAVRSLHLLLLLLEYVDVDQLVFALLVLTAARVNHVQEHPRTQWVQFGLLVGGGLVGLLQEFTRKIICRGVDLDVAHGCLACLWVTDHEHHVDCASVVLHTDGLEVVDRDVLHLL